jgi:hypothetical protein
MDIAMNNLVCSTCKFVFITFFVVGYYYFMTTWLLFFGHVDSKLLQSCERDKSFQH